MVAALAGLPLGPQLFIIGSLRYWTFLPSIFTSSDPGPMNLVGPSRCSRRSRRRCPCSRRRPCCRSSRPGSRPACPRWSRWSSSPVGLVAALADVGQRRRHERRRRAGHLANVGHGRGGDAVASFGHGRLRRIDGTLAMVSSHSCSSTAAPRKPAHDAPQTSARGPCAYPAATPALPARNRARRSRRPVPALLAAVMYAVPSRKRRPVRVSAKPQSSVRSARR